ncbi:hypothetical protein ACJIZ3_023836 [Penstemon smallii]|uniref:Transposase n=1 Tax=Penstemon smallii TaxID=265156 RepID=A0ABD3TSH4_9LAMI
MDRSWMKQSRASYVYDEGVNKFLDFAFNNASFEEKISCPCKKCRLLLPVVREVAYDHLIVFGFLKDYTTWIFHEEVKSSYNPSNESENCTNSNMDIDMDTLLHEAFGIHSPEHNVESNTPSESEDQPNVEAEEFYNFVKDAKKELYPGCKSYKKLSFIVRLFQIKCLGGWSNNSFSMLLDLLKAVLPEGETLPKSFYEMKKIIKKLGLGYEKIHACPNDCILYRKEYQNEKECPKCHASRYLVQENSSSCSNSSQIASSKVPVKVLRYFPLIPRLQRLFMCSDTAPLMSMRHPADSPAWVTFDYKNQNCSAEPQNVRLGLASDGMNPFSTKSTTYSIWPVIPMVYNLPPWMCMKPDNLILSMIIPGPGSPGNNIDIYLQPLVDELKLLYEPGMCAALMWTISDLPALAYISGWSTKGKYGCICCHIETCSKWHKHGRKFCYMDHRHDEEFDGKKEKRSAPIPLDGNTKLKMLEGFEIEFGKTSKTPNIFFELPYWKDNLGHHNLDVMHIEKNVCESIIGPLLNLEGKTKDGLNERLDLELMGLKPELHPRQDPNNKTVLPPACFSLKKEDKTTFCKFLKNIKVPDGYAANISGCVHECHIQMQQVLPLAVRGILSTNVYSCLVDLSNFFREIYSKVKRPQYFLRLERDISITLCKLEKIFPPAFFDIVVHLLVHLPREARLAGPVQYRQMYPVDR